VLQIRLKYKEKGGSVWSEISESIKGSLDANYVAEGRLQMHDGPLLLPIVKDLECNGDEYRIGGCSFQGAADIASCYGTTSSPTCAVE
jgi:hypothetical protein